MSSAAYQHAMRLGQKEVRACESRGEEAHPAALETILPGLSSMNAVPLGTVSVQLDQIVGTMTEARRDAFSCSFYPLLSESSEFATKWIALAGYHLSEGIQSPITVYEYLNRFYIVEGHKRVSVLRYFGAPSVQATVTRLLPPKSDDPELAVYWEFVEFYRKTRVNHILFHDSGNYALLYKLVTPDGVEEWGEEFRREFCANVAHFRNVLKDLTWERRLDRDEALLRYLKIYGYEQLACRSGAKLREDITIAGAEMLAEMLAETPEVHLSPDDGTAKSRLLRIVRAEPKTLKIAFLHDKTPETSYWTFAHEDGRVTAQSRLGSRVETKSFFNMLQTDPMETIRGLAAEGYHVIFTTTPRLLDVTLKAAAQYPDVKFLNCSLNISHPLLRTYYGRMYEAKFLTGVIAGAMAENGCIGYECNYPIYGMTASINAFALGAQMANPSAKVWLQWSTVPGADILGTFRANHVTAVSGQDMYAPAVPRRDFGVYLMGKDGPQNIALSIWRWGKFYRQIIESILDGRWSSLDSTEAGGRAINYWWGFSSGVLDIRYNSDLPRQTRRLVELLRRGIIDGSFLPFEGPLYDQNGVLRVADDQELTPREIVEMDWLADNVIGSIPTADSLTPAARALVEIQGVLQDKGGV